MINLDLLLKNVKLLLLAALLALVSCSSRKVAVNRQKQEVFIDSLATAKVESKRELKSDVVATLEASEMIITPIDTAKPIIINNVPYFNAKIEMRKKRETKIDKTISFETEKTQVKVQKKTALKRNVFAKQIEKTVFQWNLLLLLLVPIGYYLYKKHINKIWWV